MQAKFKTHNLVRDVFVRKKRATANELCRLASEDNPELCIFHVAVIFVITVITVTERLKLYNMGHVKSSIMTPFNSVIMRSKKTMEAQRGKWASNENILVCSSLGTRALFARRGIHKTEQLREP
jgi:hypothetical protein